MNLISVGYIVISHCFAGSWARPQGALGIRGGCRRRSLPNFPGQFLIPVVKHRHFQVHNHIHIHRVCFANLKGLYHLYYAATCLLWLLPWWLRVTLFQFLRFLSLSLVKLSPTTWSPRVIGFQSQRKTEKVWTWYCHNSYLINSCGFG